jgi:hypothetical protein
MTHFLWCGRVTLFQLSFMHLEGNTLVWRIQCVIINTWLLRNYQVIFTRLAT